MDLSGERINAGPDEGVWIGIKTNLIGKELDGRMVAVDLGIDVSHGDGMGGVTETQREVYLHILRAACARLEKGAKIFDMPGYGIQRVGQG